MRKVPVSALQPGLGLAKSVYGANNEVYLQTGAILTARYIQKLKELGFSSVYVYDPVLQDVEIPEATDVIHEETRREAVGQIRNLLLETASSHAKAVLPPKELSRTISDMVEQIIQNPSSRVINMADIRARNEYLYHHSVNVCVLALTVGAEMGLSRRELFDLGTGAVLHDVGKIKIPVEILEKPGRLTDEEFALVKRHTLIAEEMLSDNPVAAGIACMHHERVNGEGYPRGLKGAQVSLLAQITGIADVFDALIADRCYRKAYAPHEALEMLLAAGDYWFDYEVVRRFVNVVAAYPVGTLVELNTKETGAVVGTPKGFPTQPVVRVFLDAEKGWLADPYDLSTLEKRRFVVRVLDEEEVAFIKARFTGQSASRHRRDID
jgi:HD-GYP domain-containing protein (c-di-GMP phosphodiesterase class II)